MSMASVGPSSMLQWLQNYLSPAGSASGSQSPCASCTSQAASDTTSISQQAVQLNATQIAPTTDPSQMSGVNGSQGSHHHHHHGGGESNGQGNGSFIDQLARSIVTDLQQATGTGTSSDSSTPSGSNTSDSSFIDQLAGVITNDLLSEYQQSTASSPTPSSTSTTSHISTVA